MASLSFPSFSKDLTDLKGPNPIPRFGEGRPPANPRKTVVFPTGPKHLRLSKKPTKGETTVWTVPPVGFLTAHNSIEEWQVFLAISFQRKTPRNPFIGPFVGGDDWVYQKAAPATAFGHARLRAPASSVSDFAVQEGAGWLVIRLQTERFHVFTTSDIQEKDAEIAVNLQGVTDVIDIFSADFIFDTTGETVSRIVARALKHIPSPSPTGFSSAIRVRRPRT
jgi:hypothetical protein